jgi:predicted ATPase/class 3 adenylate cyclase
VLKVVSSDRPVDSGQTQRDLPAGTVTFLFTDIENSTLLVQELGERWVDVLQAQRLIMRRAIAAYEGHEIGTEGDSFFVVFASAEKGAAAVVEAQRALVAHSWPGFQVRVRMGLHTGEGKVVGDGYVGLDVHRAARIAAAGHGGQVLLSEATATLIGKALPPGALPRDLGEYRLKDLPRPEHIYQLDVEGLPTEFPALKSLDLRRNNLPLHLTTFHGREQELAEVKRLLSDVRLVTLLGPGGMGKTRLAIRVASEVLEEYEGVWLLELAPLSDGDLVAPTLLSLLGLREQPGRTPVDTLIDYLGSRKVLVVMDNCEHLMEACASLGEKLLRACPKVRILATSREALRVAAETAWRVPPLALPDPERLPPVETLAQSSAVALFADRAVTALPTFTLSEKNARLIVQICQRLDGIPLAIELAAARLSVLSVEQIATRLQDRFRLLTGGSRTALPRQQTLRATLDWSYDLLADPERALLRRVSVFAGGFNLEAAEAVCGWDPLAPDEVLDQVAALGGKSLLVISEQDAQPRYGLLETIREYAAARAGSAGEKDELDQRHRNYFLELAEEAEPRLRGPDQLLWLERLDGELDNLRAGFRCSQERDDPDPAFRFATALGLFWRARGRFSEGREWLERVLQTVKGSPALHAKALAWAGYLAIWQGAHAQAEQRAEEGLALYRKLGDPRGISFALQTLGAVALNQDDYDRAIQLEEESLSYFREVNDKSGIGLSYLYLGFIALQKAEHSRAMELLQEALTLFHQVGDKRSIAIASRVMGDVELTQGHYASATALLEESLTLVREAKDSQEIRSILQLLGRAALCEGHYSRATERFEESLKLARELGQRLGIGGSLIQLGTVARLEGDLERACRLITEGLSALDTREKYGIASALQALAHVVSAQDRPQEAAILFGAAQALREDLGTPLPSFEQEEYIKGMEKLRSLLTKADFAQLSADGRGLSLEDAVRRAFQAGGVARADVTA